MWGAPSIKDRVNKIMTERIKKAQEAHDTRVGEIEQDHEEQVQKLHEAKETAIEASADSLVKSIIGK